MTEPRRRDGGKRERDIRDSNISLGISALLGILTFTIAGGSWASILFFLTIATFVYGVMLRRDP